MLTFPPDALRHHAKPRMSRAALERTRLLDLVPKEGIAAPSLLRQTGWSAPRFDAVVGNLLADGALTHNRISGVLMLFRSTSIQCACPLMRYIALKPVLFAIANGHDTAQKIAAAIDSVDHDIAVLLAHSSKRQNPLVSRGGYVGRKTRWVLTDVGREIIGSCRCGA
jgi:hypothetical protein